MPEGVATIIAVTITAIFSMVGTVIGAKAGIKESSKLTVYRIDQLEVKVDKYNDLLTRTIHLEHRQDEIDQRVTDEVSKADQRLEDRCKLTDERIAQLRIRDDQLAGAIESLARQRT